jgi:hypothetical protein
MKILHLCIEKQKQQIVQNNLEQTWTESNFLDTTSEQIASEYLQPALVRLK